jgi:hypothetical protein
MNRRELKGGGGNRENVDKRGRGRQAGEQRQEDKTGGENTLALA